MFLDLDRTDENMKTVYKLSEALKVDPTRMVSAQALTLDPERPYMGLKGSHGLFGSTEWWENIRKGILPTVQFSGTITRMYFAGQDSRGIPNSCDLIDSKGNINMESLYANHKKDIRLYQIGHRVDILYALDELKEPNYDGKYHKITLEVAVSLEPVKV